MRGRWLALAAALGLSGCAVGPNFSPPAPPRAKSFHGTAPGVTRSNPDPAWWRGFADPDLSRLMHLAIAGSPDLKQALLRVEAAHQRAVLAGAQGLPSLNATGSYMREQEGLKGLLESSGAYSQLQQLASSASGSAPGGGQAASSGAGGALDQLNQPINFYQYELSASWELDLFGRVRRAVEAAKANAARAQDAARDAMVMLESQVAQAYFQLRATELALAQQQDSVAAAQETLQLTQSQAATGLTSDVDVEQARTELYTTQGQIPAFEKRIAQSLNQIDILCGQPPGALDGWLRTTAPLPAPPALIGAGVPSTLAERRPDVREAVDRLHAATAQVGVAVASFYPDISLTGSLGFHALDASYLTNWANLFYSAGPSISLPLFEGGKLTANLRLARVTQQSAALNYRATMLNALAEVETDLVAYRSDRTALEDAMATQQAAALTLQLARSRYARGLASFLPVLDAERSSFSAAQQVIQARAQLDDDAATLYTALGGGWQLPSAAADDGAVKPD